MEIVYAKWQQELLGCRKKKLDNTGETFWLWKTHAAKNE